MEKDIFIQLAKNNTHKSPLEGTKENPVYFLGKGKIHDKKVVFENVKKDLLNQPTLFRFFMNRNIEMWEDGAKSPILAKMIGIDFTHIFVDNCYYVEIKIKRIGSRR